jgi:hypothetical protein
MPSDNFKMLAQTQLTTSEAAIHGCPSSHETIIKYITVVNNDTSARWFTLFHSTGTTYNETTTIIPEATIPAGGWAEFNGTITMDENDIIAGKGEANTELTITLYGDEIDVS